MACSEAIPVVDMVEAADGRYWSHEEIENSLGKGIFTTNFEHEYALLKEKLKHIP